MASAIPIGHSFVASAGAPGTDRPTRSAVTGARTPGVTRLVRAGLACARFVLLVMGLWSLAACAPKGDLRTTAAAPAADAPAASSPGDGSTFYRDLIELGSVTVVDPSAGRSQHAWAEPR
jgi:hypothetical protein